MKHEVHRPICAVCGTRINKPQPGQLAHGWCSMNMRGPGTGRPVAEPNVAVEAAPARWPGSPATAEAPIRYVEAQAMPRAKKVEPILPDAPTLDQVVAEGEAYEALKAEAERIELALKRKGDFLKTALANFPDCRVRIGERDLAIVPSVTETFDLAAAKKRKALAPLLVPYIETIEKFDLKAARKHLADEQLRQFITARETLSLRFLKPQGE
jgi:hypothetical protein